MLSVSCTNELAPPEMLAYLIDMRRRAGQFFGRFASSLMLLATVGFVQQGAMIAVSQAAAVRGVMPQPAVILSGPIHVHDKLGAFVHLHGGDNSPGHVHGPADKDHHDDEEGGVTQCWSLGCASAILPAFDAFANPVEIGSVQALLQNRPEGIDPAGLIRPPSTPSIT